LASPHPHIAGLIEPEPVCPFPRHARASNRITTPSDLVATVVPLLNHDARRRGRQAVGQADAAAFVFDAVRVELVVAVRETILFLTQRFPMLSREEAYMIASVAVD